MPLLRRRSLFLLLIVLILVGLGFWLFAAADQADTRDGLRPSTWSQPTAPTVKGPPETIAYDAEAETAAEAAEAARAAAELEKEAEVPVHILALADETLSDQEVLARLRRAVLDSTLSLEERADALEHLHNLAAGRSGEQLLPVAQDPALAPDLLAEMLDESLNRDFFYQADIALSILETRREPELIEAARRQLAFLTGADSDLSIAEWRAALAKVSVNWPRE